MKSWFSAFMKVSEIMVTEYNSLSEEERLTMTMVMMLETKVNEMPIIDENKRVFGEFNFFETIKYILGNKKILAKKRSTATS